MTPQALGFLLSAAAASTALLGWLAVAAKRTWTERGVGIALLLSAAAMLVISVFELIPPALTDAATRGAAVALVLTGFVAVPILGLLLERALPTLGAARSTAVLVVLALTVHNIPEGAVALAATMVSVQAGVIAAIAIGLHNIPEGMAVATTVLAMGGSRKRAFLYTSVTVIGELIGALALLVAGRSMSPGGAALLLAAVAGVMLSLSVTQLIPAGTRLVRGTTAISEPSVAAHT